MHTVGIRLQAILFAAATVCFVSINACADEPEKGVDKIVDGAFMRTCKLKDALEQIAKRYGITVTIDEAAFAREKRPSPANDQVHLNRMSGVAFGTMLEFLLSNTDCVYDVTGRRITAVPNTKDGVERPFPPQSTRLQAGREHYMKALTKQLEIERPINASLHETLEFLADRCDITILVDNRAFRKIDKKAIV